MDALMEENEISFDEIISIQEKYKMLNPLHKAMVEETIDAYLVKENRVSI